MNPGGRERQSKMFQTSEQKIAATDTDVRSQKWPQNVQSCFLSGAAGCFTFVCLGELCENSK